MCWGVLDFSSVEEIFQGLEALVVGNDCVRGLDVHCKDNASAMFNMWLESLT